MDKRRLGKIGIILITIGVLLTVTVIFVSRRPPLDQDPLQGDPELGGERSQLVLEIQARAV